MEDQAALFQTELIVSVVFSVVGFVVFLWAYIPIIQKARY
jgi:uncharacterized protein involved in response to NO